MAKEDAKHAMASVARMPLFFTSIIARQGVVGPTYDECLSLAARLHACVEAHRLRCPGASHGYCLFEAVDVATPAV